MDAERAQRGVERPVTAGDAGSLRAGPQTRLASVRIDQDLCTGDGLCTDHCPDVFTLLEDGIAYVSQAGVIANDPGGPGSIVEVPAHLDAKVLIAADDCPGECIFVEVA